MMDHLPRFKELSVPPVEPVVFDHYPYLVKRPEKGREQPDLRGRNMTYTDIVAAIAILQRTGVEIASGFWVLNAYRWLPYRDVEITSSLQAPAGRCSVRSL